MSGVESTAADLDVDLRQLFASLGRNWLRIVLVALAVTALALAAAWMSTPYYKAETRLLIETRESVFTRPNAGSDADRPILDEEGVTSQVQVISSTDILKKVADKLDLAKLPEFNEALHPSMLGRLLVIAGLRNDPNEVPPDERVLKKLREKLNVYNIDKSRVIVIEFSSASPKLAADIPNAIADAYLDVQKGAKLESNSEATDWLAPEIADLSKRVKDAEAKVAAYRAQSGLLMGQNNAVLSTQQLSEMSSELSRVRASRASAEATAEGVRKALQTGGSLDAVPEVMNSALIQRLREQQVQLKANLADLETTMLDNHPRVRALKSQIADLSRQIRGEAEKILAGLNTQVQTAKDRETQLVAELNQLKAQSANAGEQQVELNALEREADAQRQLLESYMTRYREASSRQDRSYLPVDARVFSRAVQPADPYFPKILPIVSAAFVGSLLIMSVITLLQELFSGRAMRPATRPRLEPVEQVPMWLSHDREASAPATSHDDGDADRPGGHDEAQVSDVEAPAPVSSLGEISVETAAERLIAGGMERAVFVSPEGDEAAASSVLVAREVADSGLRVLLMDLTAAGAASRPMLDSGVYAGITNLLASEAQFGEVIHADHYSDCHVIPVGTADPVKAMRAADRLPIILQSLATAYDLVVIECGPADAKGIRRLVAEATQVFVSMLEPDEVVTDAAVELIENGYPGLTLVTPAGHKPSGTPVPGRSAA